MTCSLLPLVKKLSFQSLTFRLSNNRLSEQYKWAMVVPAALLNRQIFNCASVVIHEMASR
jgi:hypothetical protein